VTVVQQRGDGTATPDVEGLRRTVSHVVAFSTLSAVWAGAPRAQIAESLAQVLREALDADVVAVALRAMLGAPPCGGTCVRGSDTRPLGDSIQTELASRLGDPAPASQLPQLPERFGPMVVAPIGILAEHGAIAVACSDRDFPSDTDRLLLNVAANQATLALLTDYAREALAEAQRANLAKDQFLATLSHELRTPLNAVMGWLSMLRRPEVMTPAGVPKAWMAIDRNIKGLAELIEDLLDVSRIATGKLRLAETHVDLNETARDAVRAMEPLFGDKGVSLRVELSPGRCEVRGDVGRIRQVVSNLLSNAVRFTASGGLVSVAVTCDDQTATLTVSDTGIGIHPDFLPHVFERFRQEKSESTSGLGLGLAIVKNLVELHGGTVTAASDGIGRGSQFRLTLPRTARR
jgi:signal transduction histidine kinase